MTNPLCSSPLKPSASLAVSVAAAVANAHYFRRLGPFAFSYRGMSAQPLGVHTSARWSVICSGGRFGLTGRLMQSDRSL